MRSTAAMTLPSQRKCPPLSSFSISGKR